MMWPDNIDDSSLSRQMGWSPLKNPVDLFDSEPIVKICAPMVRYSKLSFRTLVRKYDCDLCYTPMIIAADFVRSLKARHSEFTTNQGVMVARGLLANPALFAGYEDTPLQCVQDWVDIALEQGTPFTCFHHHLMYMLERVTSKQEKKIFNVLSSMSAVLDYLRDNYGVR
ncbi:putative tRNA-dihydrouridine synthase protein [Naja naja]|nr:putative tRNA-dihydrouridine synthase protein [Naja naja]